MNEGQRIDRSVPIPLYYQLESILRSKIKRGELRHGDRLPTEEELRVTFGVSRGTVRQALGQLERDGLIERKRSIGSVVKEPRVDEPFASLNSYVLTLLDEGRDVRTEILQFDSVLADPTVQDQLGLKVAEPMIKLRRVTHLDGKAFNLAVSFVRRRFVPRLTREELTETGVTQSLYHVLATNHGITIESADITVAPHTLDYEQAQALGQRSDTPAIRRTRCVRDPHGNLVLCEDAVFCHVFHINASRFDAPGR